MALPGLEELELAYATLSLHKSDMIRLLNFPLAVTRAAEPIITAAWSPGIQKDLPEPGGVHSFKLKGRPWNSSSDASEVASRRLVRELFAHLYSHGWHFVTSLDHSIRLGAKDTLIFKKAAFSSPCSSSAPSSSPSPSSSPPFFPATPSAACPPQTPAWLVLSITKSDRLRVDCADQAFQARCVRAIRDVLLATAYFLSGEWNCDSYEFRLRDKPWRAHGDGWMRPRVLVLRLLGTLERSGWRSYAAVAQRTETDDVKKADSWYFVMDRSGTGLPPPAASEPSPAAVAVAATPTSPTRQQRVETAWGSRNPYNKELFSP